MQNYRYVPTPVENSYLFKRCKLQDHVIPSYDFTLGVYFHVLSVLTHEQQGDCEVISNLKDFITI